MSIFDIVGKKIAVNCRTKEEADAFIRLAIDCNLANNWEQNGNSKFEEYGEKTCYRIDTSFIYRNHVVRYSPIEYYLEDSYKIVTACEVDEIVDGLCDISKSTSDISLLF